MAGPFDLSATITKVNRAQQQLEVLNQEIREFVQHDFCEVETKTYRRVLEWRQYPRSVIEVFGFNQRYRFRDVDVDTLEARVPVRYDSLTVTLTKPLPVLDWGVLIGEIVNNLRGALDNLAYALAVSNAGPPPPDPVAHNDRWRKVSFPVAMTEKYWRDTIAKDRAWCFRPGHLVILKKLQPFYRRTAAQAERHWLRVLDELWNIDKHRNIHVVGVHPGIEGITLGPHALMQASDVKLIYARPPGSFVKNTEEIARVRTSMRRNALMGYIEANVKMEAHLIVEIAFDDGAPAYGANVIETLMGFLNHITAIILEFKPDTVEPLPLLVAQPTPSHVAPPIGGNNT